MKMVIAFIKENKLGEVMLALHKIGGLTGASSSKIHGFGRDRSKHGTTQEPEISLDFKPHVRLEIACHGELVNKVLSTIEWAAHTGLRGDGKIFVLPLEQAVRISSGERGEDAA
ncbi:MAG: P-II family nitrogen regulator [Sedimentisphaerales bacterium]|nr:P-II family nitrogen regulator [Sedimentisphaerales bacterium]